MTVAELIRHNFDEIFIELDPVKREGMMRTAYTEDCVWIHPGGRLVGIAAINEAASEIRKRIPEYRYAVIGDIRTMHNVGMCRWGSGIPISDTTDLDSKSARGHPRGCSENFSPLGG